MKQAKFERFGNYILLEKMAAGGMAEIYLAKKIGADGVQKFVAFKRILAEHSQSSSFIQMFKDEAKVAINLSHSNVVSIFEFGQEKEQLYLVMDYVEGKNLRQILNKLKKFEKRLSVSHIAYIAKMVAAGLDHAHRCIEASTGKPLNIIHRDMSPQNVMVSYEGDIKVIDFGIAKAATQQESTRVGTLKGKFGYMSPEQVDGMELDPRTDIFALGIMMWEMVSEKRLFLSNSEMATLRNVRECQVPSLREMDPNIPIEFEKIIFKALSKIKAQRYQSAAELQRDLQGFLNRYNPDFSSHDFSGFIKEVYSEDIIIARKRQVAYSQVRADESDSPSGGENNSDKTMVMSSDQTMTRSEASADISNMSFQDISFQTNVKDMEQSRVSNRSQIRTNIEKSAIINAQGTRPQARSTQPMPSRSTGIYQRPGTGTQIQAPKEKKPLPAFAVLIFVAAFSLGAFGVMNEVQPQMMAGLCHTVKGVGVPIACYKGNVKSTVTASKSAIITVESDPAGAHIFLNSKQTGQKTPSDIEVDPTKAFNISVTKSGHRGKTISLNSIPANQGLFIKLESVPTGSVIVKVIGGEAYYNKHKLKNGQKLELEANKVVTISARNPLTKAVVHKKVRVQAGETKQLLLSPK